MKTKYPLPPGYHRGICGCTCLIDGDAIEDRLRAHVEQEHGDDAHRDDDGQIIIARATDFQEAHRLVCEGFPVILRAPVTP